MALRVSPASARNMESLSETTWDVLISGKRALSRSGKKVLHIDKNDYYGGPEAALSLQEAETWAENVNTDSGSSPFRNATIRHVEKETESIASPRLGFSRAYSLSLSPQLIYTRSNLLPALVSSKVYRQLDFLAIGSWWLYDNDQEGSGNCKFTWEVEDTFSKTILRKIPGGREDVFADRSIDRRSIMSLMKFLKLAGDVDEHASILDEWGQKPFPDFLESQFRISHQLQQPLVSLTLSPDPPTDTITSFALSRIHRHLTSIGLFGPGFGSVIPKWGGLAEIAQVACRAGAVGGGVYVLNKGIGSREDQEQSLHTKKAICLDKESKLSTVILDGGEEVTTQWIVGSRWNLPPQIRDIHKDNDMDRYIARSVTIVSGTLSRLFPPPAESAPPPAGAIVVLPSSKLGGTDNKIPSSLQNDLPPVYLIVHSSDTGECPAGQCIIYGYSFHHTTSEARSFIQKAIKHLLRVVDEHPPPSILWDMHYDHRYTPPSSDDDEITKIRTDGLLNDHILQMPDTPTSVALEDDVLKHIKAIYQEIVGDEGPAFMIFEDREGIGEDSVADDGQDM